LWLLDPEIINDITKLEAQLLKMIAQMPFTTSTTEIYKNLCIVQPCYRQQNFAKNLENKNILTDIQINTCKLKSGKIRIIQPCLTLNQKLKRLCIEKPNNQPKIPFDPKKFTNWRAMTIKQISYKISINKK